MKEEYERRPQISQVAEHMMKSLTISSFGKKYLRKTDTQTLDRAVCWIYASTEAKLKK